MEVPMRQSSINPTPALRSLIAAIPDNRLRELVLEMLLASLTANAPAPATTMPAPAKRPRGRPRGPPEPPTRSWRSARSQM
jgi:hypothetical protein